MKKTTLVFGPEWSLNDFVSLLEPKGYEMKYTKGGIEVVKKVEEKRKAPVVPIRARLINVVEEFFPYGPGAA